MYVSSMGEKNPYQQTNKPQINQTKTPMKESKEQLTNLNIIKGSCLPH